MSTIEWEDESGPVFIFQEDPECRSVSKLKDVRIGEQFVFRGEIFTKRNQYGWTLGICNIVDAEGNVSHLHPTTAVSLLQ
jgi:hypothetical protein